jgi:hypothetical protein
MNISRMESSQVEDLLRIFNVNGTGSISKQEFVFCWSEWIKKASIKNAKVGVIQAALQVARPTTAFIVVDVQNDFISGSLAISNCPAGQNGEDVSKTSPYTDSTLKIVTGCFGVVFVAFIDII